MAKIDNTIVQFLRLYGTRQMSLHTWQVDHAAEAYRFLVGFDAHPQELGRASTPDGGLVVVFRNGRAWAATAEELAELQQRQAEEAAVDAITTAHAADVAKLETAHTKQLASAAARRDAALAGRK